MKDSRTPTLRQIKTSEKQKEESTTMAWDSYGQPTEKRKPSIKPGLTLEKKLNHEKRRWHFLTNEHNRLTFAVNKEEANLKQLQESLNNSVQSTYPINEDTCKQSMRKLENNKDKIKTKIIEATEIHTAYEHICEHLQQEVQAMFRALEKKQRAIAIGQAEVDRATKQFQSAAADCTVGKLVEMEDGTMRMKREMENELCKLRAEDKELKKKMGSVEPFSSTGQSRQKEQENEEQEVKKEEEEEEEEEVEEEEHLFSVVDYQCFEACGASQFDLELVEGMEALKEALGYTEVQELVDKVLSQQVIKEQLSAEIAQYEDMTSKEAKVLAELELQYAELQFRAKPAVTRVEMQAELKQKVAHVQRLQAELKQCQDLLDTVERGVNNLYFTMSCVPVEGMPSAPSNDCSDRLGDVRARLPTLVRKASAKEPESSGLDQDKALSSSAEAD